ncbi:MAG: DUF4239 domain-containing protein [Bacteroidota bacterium]|nr:DUF4239 domain-containing protein [Bacteroidota bacterium]
MDSIPLEIIFIATVILLYISMELGYRIGNRLPDNLKKLKEKVTSSNATAVLGMLGFMLVFSFGIVYSRYDSKKELVREEANLIRTSWLRSDFLPEPNRFEAQKLLRQYVDLRIDLAEKNDLGNVQNILNESDEIQMKLWDMAVANARMDMNSDVAALYIESLNDIINQQALRVAVGIQARLPSAIWLMLYALIILGMFCVGYEAAISGSSKMTWLTPIMIFSFSLVIYIIASLDRPGSNIIPVSQQPIIDLKNWIGKLR